MSRVDPHTMPDEHSDDASIASDPLRQLEVELDQWQQLGVNSPPTTQISPIRPPTIGTSTHALSQVNTEENTTSPNHTHHTMSQTRQLTPASAYAHISSSMKHLSVSLSPSGSTSPSPYSPWIAAHMSNSHWPNGHGGSHSAIAHNNNTSFQRLYSGRSSASTPKMFSSMSPTASLTLRSPTPSTASHNSTLNNSSQVHALESQVSALQKTLRANLVNFDVELKKGQQYAIEMLGAKLQAKQATERSEQAEATIEQLRQDKSRTDERLAALQSQLDALQHAHSSCGTALDRAKLDLASMAEKSAEHRLAAHQSHLEQLNTAMRRADDADRRRIELEDALDTMRRDKRGLEEHLIAQLTAAEDRMERAKQQHESEIEQINAACEQRLKSDQAANSKLDALKQQLDSLQQQLDSERAGHAATRASSRAASDGATSSARDAQSKIHTLELQVSTLTQERSHALDLNRSIEQRLKIETERMNAIETQAGQLRTANRALERELTAKRNALDEARREVTQLRIQLTQYDADESTLAESDSTNRALRLQVLELTSAAAQRKEHQHHQHHSSDDAASEARIASLTDQLHHASSQLLSARMLVSTQEASIENLQSQTSKLEQLLQVQTDTHGKYVNELLSKHVLREQEFSQERVELLQATSISSANAHVLSTKLEFQQDSQRTLESSLELHLEQLSNLRSELSQRTHEKDATQAELDTVRMKLTRTIEEYDEFKDSVTSSLKTLEEEISSKEDRFKMKELECVSLQKELKDALDSMKGLSRELEDTHQNHAMRLQDLERTHVAQQAVQVVSIQHERELKLMEQLSQVRQEQTQIMAKLTTTEEELNRTRDDARKERATLQEEYSLLQAKSTAAEAEFQLRLASLDSDSHQRASDAAHAHAQVASELASRVSELDSMRARLETQQSTSQAEQRRLHDECARFKLELQQSRSEFERTLELEQQCVIESDQGRLKLTTQLETTLEELKQCQTSCEALKYECEGIQRKLTESQNELQQARDLLQQQSLESQNELNDLRLAHDRTLADLRALSARHQVATSDIARFESDLTAARQQIAQLEDDQRERQATMKMDAQERETQLEEKIQQMKLTHEQLLQQHAHEIDSKEAQLSSLSTTNLNLQGDISSLIDQVANLTNQLSLFESDRLASDARLNDVNAAHGASESALQLAESDLATTKHELADLKLKFDTNEATRVESHRLESELRSSRDAMTVELEDASSKNIQLSQFVQQLEARCSELDEQIHTLQLEHRSNEVEHGRIIDTLHARIDTLQNEIDDANNKSDADENNIQTLKEKIIQAQQALDEHVSYKSASDSRLASLESDLAAGAARESSLRSDLDTTRTTGESLTAQLQTTVRSLDDAQATIRTLESNAAALKSSNDELEAIISLRINNPYLTHDGTHATIDARLQTMQDELSRCDAGRVAALREVHKLQSDVTRLNAKLRVRAPFSPVPVFLPRAPTQATPANGGEDSVPPTPATPATGVKNKTREEDSAKGNHPHATNHNDYTLTQPEFDANLSPDKLVVGLSSPYHPDAVDRLDAECQLFADDNNDYRNVTSPMRPITVGRSPNNADSNRDGALAYSHASQSQPATPVARSHTALLTPVAPMPHAHAQHDEEDPLDEDGDDADDDGGLYDYDGSASPVDDVDDVDLHDVRMDSRPSLPPLLLPTSLTQFDPSSPPVSDRRDGQIDREVDRLINAEATYEEERPIDSELHRLHPETHAPTTTHQHSPFRLHADLNTFLSHMPPPYLNGSPTYSDRSDHSAHAPVAAASDAPHALATGGLARSPSKPIEMTHERHTWMK